MKILYTLKDNNRSSWRWTLEYVQDIQSRTQSQNNAEGEWGHHHNERNRYPMSLIIKFAVESNEIDKRLALFKINNSLSSD